ncbi:hypothetical protein [Rhizorhapis suberifaciens]|uniref:DUF1761 domain-containing protein n=1 Tax=Rhizorhapis suberifaciens TaxID=13656 RepID=A0A840HSH5_9SPHN|nr:hypothetical protein [Rhizorhapis suberifaciens]MBB4640577.1 hypothetical protein [Rhizorhapis suberifaciens]
MIRTILGGLAGGLAMYLVGFVFWGTPLSRIALSKADDMQSAVIQQALAANLTQNGTGTYPIPWPGTPAGTTLYGKGPTAMVHFNTSGFPVSDSGALLAGLILAMICALIIAFGLRAAGPYFSDFASRAKLVIAFAVAIPLYIHIGQPIFNHAPWSYFIYSFLADGLGFIAAGLVITRWFMAERRPLE